MVSLVIVMLDEALKAGVKVTGQEVVFQQNSVLQGLVPALDLALCLRMIGRAPEVIHFLRAKPVCQFTGDVTGTIV